jgi:Raf kinase inhibitor-like YbhB/YbcL family protein
MQVASPEFATGQLLPRKFTCDGADVNPPLTFEEIPAGTKSLAVILDDPDAPRRPFVHWVIYNMPVITRLDEDSAPGTQGLNDYGRLEYGGPCPPAGPAHRYVFKLYALDTELAVKGRVDKDALEKAMQGHILARAECIGLYARGSRFRR